MSIEVREIKLTQEQCEAIVKRAEDKVEEIMQQGPEEIIARTLFIAPQQRTDYLHDKALEQCQINAFYKALALNSSIHDICDLEDHYSDNTEGDAQEAAVNRHDRYVDLNNDYACQLLVELALDILTQDEIDEILK